MGCGSIDPGLPDIHGAIGLAAVRHVPDTFPPHEHIGNAADDRPDDIGRAVGPAGSGGALSDVPDFRDGTGRGGADLCDAGYRRDVKQRPRDQSPKPLLKNQYFRRICDGFSRIDFPAKKECTGRTRLMSKEI